MANKKPLINYVGALKELQSGDKIAAADLDYTGIAGGKTIIGGTDITDILKFIGTSGNGTLTSPAIQLLVGNNGATTALTALNNGNIIIPQSVMIGGTTAPNTNLETIGKFQVRGSSSPGPDGSGTAAGEGLHLTYVDSTDIGRVSSYTGTANGTLQLLGNDVQLYYGAGYQGLTLNSSGNVGILTTLPTNILSFGGNEARTIWLERHTTANTAGNSLTVQGGGATPAATDKNGGDLLLLPGVSTGTGECGVQIKGCVAGTTGTTDNSFSTILQILGNKLGFYGVAPIARAILATGAGHTVDDIIIALQNLGLVKQS